MEIGVFGVSQSRQISLLMEYLYMNMYRGLEISLKMKPQIPQAQIRFFRFKISAEEGVSEADLCLATMRFFEDIFPAMDARGAHKMCVIAFGCPPPVAC